MDTEEADVVDEDDVEDEDEDDFEDEDDDLAPFTLDTSNKPIIMARITAY